MSVKSATPSPAIHNSHCIHVARVKDSSKAALAWRISSVLYSSPLVSRHFFSQVFIGWRAFVLSVRVCVFCVGRTSGQEERFKKAASAKQLQLVSAVDVPACVVVKSGDASDAGEVLQVKARERQHS